MALPEDFEEVAFIKQQIRQLVSDLPCGTVTVALIEIIQELIAQMNQPEFTATVKAAVKEMLI